MNHLSLALFSLIQDWARSDLHRGEEKASVNISVPFSNMTQKDWAMAVNLWLKHGRHLIPDLPQRDCPACGCDKHRFIFESYDGFPFDECDDCRCWYVPFKVDEALFDRFFDLCPEAREVVKRSLEKRASPENLDLDRVRIGGYLDTLQPFRPADKQPNRYLDVGCGLGNSLLIASEQGMEAIGVDTSVQSVSIARQRGLDARHVLGGLPQGSFVLVSFWESLEHMHSPCEMLTQVLPLLAEDGIVAFTVPNQNWPPVRSMRGDCSVVNGGFDTPGHINLFEPGSLERLFDRAGLTLLDIDGQCGTDLPEFFSYLLGQHRGTADLLSGQPKEVKLPADAMATISAIGPAISVLERLACVSPILSGIACRKGREKQLSGPLDTLRSNRTAQMASYGQPIIAEYHRMLAAREQQVKELTERLTVIEKDIAYRIAKRLTIRFTPQRKQE